MKKLCVAILGLSVAAVGAPVLMHGKLPASIQNDKQSDLMDIKGTVRSENTKITFVADEGGKSWDVVNPETLKDHVGQHVQRRGTPIAVEINAALSIFLPSVESPQIEVARAKVVVHDIHEHADSSLVRGVHKFL